MSLSTPNTTFLEYIFRSWFDFCKFWMAKKQANQLKIMAFALQVISIHLVSQYTALFGKQSKDCKDNGYKVSIRRRIAVELDCDGE